MPEPGDVLAGRYRLVEPLGEGGMGTVWRAEHVELGSLVAVKLISEGVSSSETTLARFRREAKAAAALSSPHVVQIFDYGVDNDTPYIAMELLKGESLAQRLKRMRTLPVEQVVRLVTQIAKAIDKAHRVGVLHRDMKPDNVFISTADEDEEIVKLLDFGVAKTLKPDIVGTVSSHTRTGALVGSPYYMGPEQIRGQKNIDHRADLWSIGVMAYEALTGKRPFDGESLGDLVMSVCSDPLPVPSEHGGKLPGFDGWFAKACARKPDDRFQSGRELANALRSLAGQSIMDEETRESLLDASVPSTRDESTATAVATTSGLARTHETDAEAAARSARTRLMVVAAVAVAVAAIAVVALLQPWSAGGAPDQASSGEPNDPGTSEPEATPTAAPDRVPEAATSVDSAASSTAAPTHAVVDGGRDPAAPSAAASAPSPTSGPASDTMP